MELKTSLLARLKDAMKSQNKDELSTLRLISAKVKDLEINARGKGKELTNTDLLQGVRSMVKSSKDSLDAFVAGKRDDLVEKTQKEIAVLESFLPQGPSIAQIQSAVAEAIAETKATTLKEQGKVMGAVKAKLGPLVDMSEVRKFVTEKLS